MKAKAARTLGISIKRLDGWEPVETTRHVYDEETGRLVESVTTRESEWDDEQQTWMLALHLLEADTCDGCGGQLSETTSPEMEDRYVPDPPVRCHKCTALHIGADQHKDSRHRQALRFTAHARG